MRIVASAVAVLLCLAAWPPKEAVVRSASGDGLPAVELSTSLGGPRELEDLTRQKILHDYASAWQTLTTGLAQNQAATLNAYFTGFAKKEFAQTIAEQSAIGIHREYVDHGHKLQLVFYSPDGGMIQLSDSADFEVQILDGTKLLHSERTPVKFIVVMTPAADRWMVRLLQDVPVS